MPCEILIHRNKNNYNHVDSEKNKSGVYKKGYLIIAKDVPCVWGSFEKFDHGKFVIVRVTNATADEINNYIKEWELEVDHKHVASDLSIDGHRYKLFATNPGVSLRGVITRDKAEKYLDNWNVKIHSVANNEITMDIIILNMLRSKGFWDEPETLQGLTATEISYDQSSGEHQIEINWSNFIPNFPRNKVATKLQNLIVKRGGSIISANLENQSGVFSITRNNVLQWFKQDIYQTIKKNNILYRRQFYLAENVVDQLVTYSNNHNGEPYVVTKAQLANYVNSFLDRADA